MTITQIEEPTFTASIYVGLKERATGIIADKSIALDCIQQYVNSVGLCVAHDCGNDIADAILEAQAEEAERPTILEPGTAYFYHLNFIERAASLRAQIGAKP